MPLCDIVARSPLHADRSVGHWNLKVTQSLGFGLRPMTHVEGSKDKLPAILKLNVDVMFVQHGLCSIVVSDPFSVVRQPMVTEASQPSDCVGSLGARAVAPDLSIIGCRSYWM